MSFRIPNLSVLLSGSSSHRVGRIRDLLYTDNNLHTRRVCHRAGKNAPPGARQIPQTFGVASPLVPCTACADSVHRELRGLVGHRRETTVVVIHKAPVHATTMSTLAETSRRGPRHPSSPTIRRPARVYDLVVVAFGGDGTLNEVSQRPSPARTPLSPPSLAAPPMSSPGSIGLPRTISVATAVTVLLEALDAGQRSIRIGLGAVEGSLLLLFTLRCRLRCRRGGRTSRTPRSRWKRWARPSTVHLVRRHRLPGSSRVRPHATESLAASHRRQRAGTHRRRLLPRSVLLNANPYTYPRQPGVRHSFRPLTLQRPTDGGLVDQVRGTRHPRRHASLPRCAVCRAQPDRPMEGLQGHLDIATGVRSLVIAERPAFALPGRR